MFSFNFFSLLCDEFTVLLVISQEHSHCISGAQVLAELPPGCALVAHSRTRVRVVGHGV